MFTFLIIIALFAVAGIYAIQFQIVRDYQPRDLFGAITPIGYNHSVKYYTCRIKRYSIFDWKRIEL